VSVKVIHSQAGLVDVIFRDDLQAVNLIWHSEYDEGTGVKDAVMAALAYVKANGVKHWLADLSRSTAPLSDIDMAWVNGEEFIAAVRDSGLSHFVLVPPLPSTGRDVSWLADWERNTLAAFGAKTVARILSEDLEIKTFFGAS
jgi:hypothetical protein